MHGIYTLKLHAGEKRREDEASSEQGGANQGIINIKKSPTANSELTQLRRYLRTTYTKYCALCFSDAIAPCVAQQKVYFLCWHTGFCKWMHFFLKSLSMLYATCKIDAISITCASCMIQSDAGISSIYALVHTPARHMNAVRHQVKTLPWPYIFDSAVYAYNHTCNTTANSASWINLAPSMRSGFFCTQ